MSDEDKDIIDLEVTSFMTACAAGVDALKALLQRERLRRLEASASNGGVGNGAGIDNGGVAGGGMRPGSRPAHENVAVTFLFERLKAVTEVAETMQVWVGRVEVAVAAVGEWVCDYVVRCAVCRADFVLITNIESGNSCFVWIERDTVQSTAYSSLGFILASFDIVMSCTFS